MQHIGALVIGQESNAPALYKQSKKIVPASKNLWPKFETRGNRWKQMKGNQDSIFQNKAHKRPIHHLGFLLASQKSFRERDTE